MFELIAILGLAGIVVSCAVNLVEMAMFDPDGESEMTYTAEEPAVSAKKYIA